jgi:hypothetical protein
VGGRSASEVRRGPLEDLDLVPRAPRTGAVVDVGLGDPVAQAAVGDPEQSKRPAFHATERAPQRADGTPPLYTRGIRTPSDTTTRRLAAGVRQPGVAPQPLS